MELQIVDFGTSKHINSKLDKEEYKGKESLKMTTSTGAQGTWSHMAPELLKKRRRGEIYEYDPFKCDMWSLGVTFYQLLTNRLPFDANTPEEMRVCLRNDQL